VESLVNPVEFGVNDKGERSTSSVPVRIVGLRILHGSAGIHHGALTSPLLPSLQIRPGRGHEMIRKLATGEFRLYSRKKDPDTGKRRNLGTFKTRAAAEKHEREVQFFKRQG
jgi:hypothetical protein